MKVFMQKEKGRFVIFRLNHKSAFYF